MQGKELQCLTCDGAGLVKLPPDRRQAAGTFWGVELCPGCNGVGVVYVDGPRVIKYDLDAKVKCAVIGPA